MTIYRLSEAAENDLDRLYTYGVLNFGLEQTEQYTTAMIARFEELAAFPSRYPAVDHIREGYRRSVYGAHSIYYRIHNDGIVIVRVLGRQNPAEHL